GDGSPSRPLIHVEDMARAFSAFLGADARTRSGEIFNVGSMAQNYRVSEIAARVGEAFPGCRIEYSARPDADSRSYRVDFSKLARALPGFACRRDVAETAAVLARVFPAVRRGGPS